MLLSISTLRNPHVAARRAGLDLSVLITRNARCRLSLSSGSQVSGVSKAEVQRLRADALGFSPPSGLLLVIGCSEAQPKEAARIISRTLQRETKVSLIRRGGGLTTSQSSDESWSKVFKAAGGNLDHGGSRSPSPSISGWSALLATAHSNSHPGNDVEEVSSRTPPAPFQSEKENSPFVESSGLEPTRRPRLPESERKNKYAPRPGSRGDSHWTRQPRELKYSIPMAQSGSQTRRHSLSHRRGRVMSKSLDGRTTTRQDQARLVSCTGASNLASLMQMGPSQGQAGSESHHCPMDRTKAHERHTDSPRGRNRPGTCTGPAGIARQIERKGAIACGQFTCVDSCQWCIDCSSQARCCAREQ